MKSVRNIAGKEYNADRIEVIKEALQPAFDLYKSRIVFGYLFGSGATGTISPLSDIDIAIYVADSDEFSLSDKALFYGECCRSLKRDDIDLVILNQTKNLILLDEIVRNGIVLIDNEEDLRMEFESKIIHLAIDFMHQRKRAFEI